MTQLLRANYDLVATASTAAVFAALQVPRPFWIGFGVLLAVQIGNRMVRGWSR